MSSKSAALLPSAARGIKRSCANDECGRRFYDLNALPKPCPYCGTMFVAQPVRMTDASTYVRPSKAKVYKLQQLPLPEDEPLASAGTPVIDAEEEAEEVSADEIPEIEEEEEDDLLPDGIAERGEA